MQWVNVFENKPETYSKVLAITDVGSTLQVVEMMWTGTEWINYSSRSEYVMPNPYYWCVYPPVPDDLEKTIRNFTS